MLNKARKNCVRFSNITFQKANITSLPYADESFDKVVAGNVIHLLDQPLAALKELDRVCKTNGLLIIPTYMNKNKGNKTNGFVRTVGKAGADFKREFTTTTYKQFFEEAGYSDVTIEEAEGRIPCAVAIMKKKRK
ncbi:MAG: class I SAM-dependent methyltransferase [Erysipelotrichaceae bacterium]|nr:class I SAM-dependent methyltransferase [Erysipelotrichaceae bacterium]